ncbi:FkbM family methyltransferase [Natronoarchaeum mannanilyticum]|uniref:FkbM family methyltransferase n=1 Tax=Natronoarchaeum mannanilyticum TaxID=926360 RepID=UPI0031E37229
MYNSKRVLASTLLGTIINSGPPHRPYYESGIANSLRTWVDEGDQVVIVGGGWGVTAAIAAEVVGPSGHVHVFEGSKQHTQYVKETAQLNNVKERISVTHAIVGTEVSLRGDSGEAQSLSPQELPECDILELDCEGSELEILHNMTIDPRIMIVESHGHLGTPSDRVRDTLENKEYQIVSEEVADRGLLDECINNDVSVLTGVKNP